MYETPRLMAATAAMAFATACVGGSNPLEPSLVPIDNEVFKLLEVRQHYWCEEITGSMCSVRVSAAHPEFAAWVEWRMHPPNILWNDRVLTDRQFWITDPRLAHEACHLKHGLQPDWSYEQKEDYANQCAIAHTGAPY
jgi:hypothetical protein